MLSENSQKTLAGLLLGVAECEKQVDGSRQELCTHPKFSVHTSFKLIDSGSNGKLTCNDFTFFLSKRSMAITRVYLDQLIFQYDVNKDGKLSMDEFSSFVIPFEVKNSGLEKKRFPASLYIESLLARHIELECNWQGQLQTHKRLLYVKSDFTPIGAFRCLKPNVNSFIDLASIRDFLIKFKRDVGVSDCERILRRLDKDNDKVIGYEDFVQFILPADKRLPKNKDTLGGRAQTRTGLRPKLQSPVKFDNRPLTRMYSTKNTVSVNKDFDLQEILKVFGSQIAIDSEIEALRVKLVKNPGFCFQEIFEFFDTDKSGFIGLNQIEKVLRQIQVPFHVDEIFLMVKNFTNNIERKLSFVEFKAVVLPFEYLETRRNGLVNRNLLEDLGNLLRVILRCENYAEGIRKKISQEGSIDYYRTFDRIDSDQDGLISLIDLERLFETQGVNNNSGDLNRLVRRYTKSNSREITYSDFLQELTPKITN